MHDLYANLLSIKEFLRQKLSYSCITCLDLYWYHSLLIVPMQLVTKCE